MLVLATIFWSDCGPLATPDDLHRFHGQFILYLIVHRLGGPGHMGLMPCPDQVLPEDRGSSNMQSRIKRLFPGCVKEAFPRLRDYLSGCGGEFTQLRNSVYLAILEIYQLGLSLQI